MDNLADLLAKRKREEPPEIQVIKAYVLHHFQQPVGVMVKEREIVITVRSSALAGALRTHTVKLLDKIGGEQKRLVFRIGSVQGS